MNHASQRNGIAPSRRRLAAVAALSFLPVPALLGSGCAAPPSGTDTEGQIGQVTQNLTQCVTFQRGASGAVADAMLSSPPAGQNYGASPILRVGGKDESLLRFDLSSIPASAVVNSATLKLYVNGSAGDLGVNIHAATAAWSEGTVTFGNFNQQYANGVSGVLLPSSPNALKSADVTALVASWVSGAQANNGMLLETSDRKKSIFVSSDAGGSAQRPALTVCYTTPDDHCAPNPCAHGSCQNGASGYTCSCDAGWTGTNCDVNMHQCDDQPCQNGATCTNEPNGYTCACAPGYSGTHCETLVDNCAPNPCQNTGVCTNGVNTHTCACAPGFTGTNCEVNINDCALAPCVHGACTDGVNSYSCACDAGFTGQNCEIDIDECVGNQCQNSATCVDDIASYTCACLPGFGGTYCQDNLNECGTQPCLNGGTCTDGVNSYTCACAPGYTGTNCEIDIDDCETAPCLNAGNCVDGVNSYTCACAPGWTGTDCEVPVTGTCKCIDQAPAIWQDVQTMPVNMGSCQNGGIHGLGPWAMVNVSNGGQLTCTLRSWSPPYDSISLPISAADADVCLADFAAACFANSCASNPCQNGGTCDSGNANYGYTCQCPAGYTGKNCETQADPCSINNPCVHGTCAGDGQGGTTCNCDPFWLGATCDEPACPCQVYPDWGPDNYTGCYYQDPNDVGDLLLLVNADGTSSPMAFDYRPQAPPTCWSNYIPSGAMDISGTQYEACFDYLRALDAASNNLCGQCVQPSPVCGPGVQCNSTIADGLTCGY